MTVGEMEERKFEAITEVLKGNKAAGNAYNARRDSNCKAYMLPSGLRADEEPYLICTKNGLRVYPFDVLQALIMREHLNGRQHYKMVRLWHFLKDNRGIQASRETIKRVILKCKTCALTKRAKPPAVTLVPLPVEKDVFERIQVDLIELTGQVSALGHRYVMCIVDFSAPNEGGT